MVPETIPRVAEEGVALKDQIWGIGLEALRHLSCEPSGLPTFLARPPANPRRGGGWLEQMDGCGWIGLEPRSACHDAQGHAVAEGVKGTAQGLQVSGGTRGSTQGDAFGCDEVEDVGRG